MGSENERGKHWIPSGVLLWHGCFPSLPQIPVLKPLTLLLQCESMRSRSFWGVIRVPCTQVVRVPHDWRPAGWHMHTCACSPSLREDVVRRLPSASQEEGLHQSPPMLAPSSQTAQPPELWEICLLFKPCRRWHFVITA